MVVETSNKKKKGQGLKYLITGGVLQCVEAATLGLPFEVWKTRMGRFRSETTMQAFWQIYSKGITNFWSGFWPKQVEGMSKGGVLLFSKEKIIDAMAKTSVGPVATGLIAGAGGGVAQVTVMAPMTYLVTAVVNSTAAKEEKVMDIARRTFNDKGIKGFYIGGTAIAFRQASNWASRQGLTEIFRQMIYRFAYKGDRTKKLSMGQEAISGMIGGMLSCWNQPFEVARIEMQSRTSSGQSSITMTGVFKMVYKEHGIAGLFKGVIPRSGLCMWQTLFMVSGAKIIRDKFNW